MKKLIIFSTVTTLLLLSVNSYAQNCKFHKDETDPFTKEHVRSSGPIRLSVTPIWWAQLEQKGTSYSLMLNISLIKQVRM